MIDSCSHLALEVKSLDAAHEFYAVDLSLPVVERSDSAVRLRAGETDLVLRRPTTVPRGGLHTHFAFTVPAAAYEDWLARLRPDHEVSQHRFGDVSSLYLYDPDGNCVELGESDVGEAGDGITGVFEVVLEVADLDRAESFYLDLGFEPIDRGEDRQRVRLRGPFDLELWEPHLGIADARGGVHVDLGFASESPDAALSAVRDRASDVEAVTGGHRFRDPDGHVLTVRSPA
jgi:catechol 2,3-dioxygenase-like lactoylglutathione lyase family enzyme